MIRALRRRGPAALGAGLAAVLVAATACGGDDGSASASGGGKVTLTVNVFGNFGYEELYKQFEAAHPNIKIIERGTGSDLSNYTPALTQNLAAGSGAGDVVALEEGIMIQFKEQPQNFVDLGRVRRQRRQGQLPALEVRPAASPPDGSKLIGLGTDVGRMGMCYRTRPVRQGRPADRPRRGRQALADLGRLHRPSASSSRPRTPARSGSTRRPTRTTRSCVQSAGKDPGYTLLRQEQRPGRRLQPGDQAGVRPDAGDDRRRACRPATSPSPTSGTPASRRARSRPSPARPGCSATSRARPVTATRASGTSPRRPAAAATGAAPAWRCRSRASTPRRRPSWSEFLTSPQGQIAAFKAVEQPAVLAAGAGRPGAPGVHQPVLQQRSGRQDLRHRRQELKPVYSARRTRRSGTRWRTHCCAVSRAS